MDHKSLTVSKDFDNYIRLQIIAQKSNELLAAIFVTKWNASEESKWEDSDMNRDDFISGPGKELFENSPELKKKFLGSRRVLEWDISFLNKAIKCLKNVNDADKIFFQVLESLQIKFRNLELEVSDEDFDKYWNQISRLLIKYEYPQSEIDAIRSMPIIPESNTVTLRITSDVYKQIHLGNEAIGNKLYQKAIDYYTEAICSSNVPYKEVADFHYHRSMAFLALGYISPAKEDGLSLVRMHPTCSFGYDILAMVYKADEEHHLALKNLLLCQRFHHDPKKWEDKINLCKQLVNPKEKENLLLTCETKEDSLKKAFNAGIALGFGFAYYDGDGVPQDFKKAAKFLRKAAPESKEALFYLAIIHGSGKGAEFDFNKCINYLKDVASQSGFQELENSFHVFPFVTAAQEKLGLAYEQGFWVIKNVERARYWYERAIKNWSGPSANRIGKMYANGVGVPISIDLAIEYWKIGAVIGNVECMDNLVHSYYKLKNFEKMQLWCLYAKEHESKIGSIIKFKKHFQVSITQNFQSEQFAKSLLIEIENGPLKHLFDKRIKDSYSGDSACKRILSKIEKYTFVKEL